MTKDEALKLALEALENISTALREDDVLGSDIELMLNTITAIREALAQPTLGYAKKIEELIQERDALRALAQPAQEPVAWVGLTDEELFEIMDKANTRYQAVQMTQAKLRELNAPQIDPNQWAFDNGLEST